MHTKRKQKAIPAGKWEILFKKASIEKEKLEVAMSERGRSTIIGNFLSQNVGREVPIEINSRTGKATLRMVLGSGKQKRYFFEILWDEPKGEKKTPSKTGSKKVVIAKKAGGAVSKKNIVKNNAVAKPVRKRETQVNHEAWEEEGRSD